MNRSDFGVWGLGLTPDDFARALCAAGLEGVLIESFLSGEEEAPALAKALEHDPMWWDDPRGLFPSDPELRPPAGDGGK